MPAPTDKYDETGTKMPIGDTLSRVFSGPELLNGNGGSDMQMLAEEIKKYDGDNSGPDSLANRLYLGNIKGDVTGKIAAYGFGLGFGLTDNITIYGGAPYLNVSVDAKLIYDGTGNNAKQIKDELGDIAFDELKEGLDKAAALNQETIEQQITSFDYAPLGKWEKAGMGHFFVGLRAGWKKRLSSVWTYGFGPAVELTLPTGYTDNPDILQDVAFGEPYYSLKTNVDQQFSLIKKFHIGLHTGYTLNLSNSVEKRVPEDKEQFIPIDRKIKVKITPGDDTDLAVSFGFTMPFFEINFRTGMKRHFSDAYSGSIEGNYNTLALNSDKEVMYNQISLSFETVNAYTANKFGFPFILTGTARIPMKARNTMDVERYYEVSFASFLPTPLADLKPKKDKDGKKIKKKKKRHSKF